MGAPSTSADTFRRSFIERYDPIDLFPLNLGGLGVLAVNPTIFDASA